MPPTRGTALALYFAGYAVVTALMFLFTPRIVGNPYLMPWHYSWVFAVVTPAITAAVLVRAVRRGWCNSTAATAFVAATLLLGFGYWWLGEQLTRAVS